MEKESHSEAQAMAEGQHPGADGMKKQNYNISYVAMAPKQQAEADAQR